MVVTGKQIRAARGLVGWSRQKLADKALLSAAAVARLERGEVESLGVTLDAVERVLVAAGVVFIPAGNGLGPGVRLAKEEKEPTRSRRRRRARG